MVVILKGAKKWEMVGFSPEAKKELKKRKSAKGCSSIEEYVMSLVEEDKTNRDYIREGFVEIARLSNLDDPAGEYSDITNLMFSILIRTLNNPNKEYKKLFTLLSKYMEGE